MRTSAKLGLTALMATLLLASAISTASARNLSVSNTNIRATWSSLEFTSAATIRCRVTLEGSLHSRTFVKSRGTLIGGITRIDSDLLNCTGGRGRPLSQQGHLTYEGFAGTLPTITAVFLLLSRLRFRIILPGICTGDYGISGDNITGQAAISGGEITTITPIEGRNRSTLLTGSGFCPATGAFAGRSNNLTLLNSTVRIRITLI